MSVDNKITIKCVLDLEVGIQSSGNNPRQEAEAALASLIEEIGVARSCFKSGSVRVEWTARYDPATDGYTPGEETFAIVDGLIY